MIIWRVKGIANNENINNWVGEAISVYNEAMGKRACNQIQLRLALEEILLGCQNVYGMNTECTLEAKKIYGKVMFRICQHGEHVDPRESENLPEFSQMILQQSGYKPSYSYSETEGNCITLYASKKKFQLGLIGRIVIGAALAGFVFLILQLVAPEIEEEVSENIVNPIFTKMTSLITEVSTPLIFLAVISGVAGIGDAASLEKIGKKFFFGSMFTYLIAAAATTLFAILVYPIGIGTAGNGQGVLKELLQLVLDIIPNNLIEPFSQDNALQVVVIAIFIGCVLVAFGQKSARVKVAVSDMAEIVYKMMEWLCELIPIIVFFGILNILTNKALAIDSIIKTIGVFVAASCIVVLYIVIRTCVTVKAPFKLLFQKQAATTIINLTTSSQVSALPENMICCKKRFGIPERLVDFALPLGMVVYMPCGSVFLMLMGWCLGEIQGISIGISEIILIILISTILAIAAPPIPGSAFAVMPIMITALGISQDYYPIAVILGTIIGYFLPALNGYCLQLQLLLTAHQLDMVDREALLKE